jgi:hypothetical protein
LLQPTSDPLPLTPCGIRASLRSLASRKPRAVSPRHSRGFFI